MDKIKISLVVEVPADKYCYKYTEGWCQFYYISERGVNKCNLFGFVDQVSDDDGVLKPEGCADRHSLINELRGIACPECGREVIGKSVLWGGKPTERKVYHCNHCSVWIDVEKLNDPTITCQECGGEMVNSTPDAVLARYECKRCNNLYIE